MSRLDDAYWAERRRREQEEREAVQRRQEMTASLAVAERALSDDIHRFLKAMKSAGSPGRVGGLRSRCWVLVAERYADPEGGDARSGVVVTTKGRFRWLEGSYDDGLTEEPQHPWMVTADLLASAMAHELNMYRVHL